MVGPMRSVVTEITVAVTVTVPWPSFSLMLLTVLAAERSAAITALDADSSVDAIAIEAEA